MLQYWNMSSFRAYNWICSRCFAVLICGLTYLITRITNTHCIFCNITQAQTLLYFCGVLRDVTAQSLSEEMECICEQLVSSLDPGWAELWLGHSNYDHTLIYTISPPTTWCFYYHVSLWRLYVQSKKEEFIYFLPHIDLWMTARKFSLGFIRPDHHLSQDSCL